MEGEKSCSEKHFCLHVLQDLQNSQKCTHPQSGQILLWWKTNIHYHHNTVELPFYCISDFLIGQKVVLSSFSAEVLLGFLISFSDNVISLMTFVRVFFPYLFSSKFLENFIILLTISFPEIQTIFQVRLHCNCLLLLCFQK